MTKEIPRPTCPFKHTAEYVPPRFQQGPITTALNLGPLASLAGSWKGRGFNAIWRPDNPQSQPESQIHRFLELNLTSESFDFQVIPGVVPNRGLAPQTDLSLYGLHYLQRVTDADQPPFSTAGQALHIEPGLFMNVPSSLDPQNPSTIVRMASIPHGVTVMMQGPNPGNTPVPGAPVIPPIYPIAGLPVIQPPLPPGTLGLGIQPIDVPNPPNAAVSTPHAAAIEGNLSLDNTAVPGNSQQANGPFPIDPFQAYVNDPNQALRDAIAGQEILGHITIDLSSTAAGDDIANIPFLGLPNAAQPDVPNGPANAFVYSAAATFWIEWVRNEGYPRLPFPPLPDGGRLPLLEIEPFWPQSTHLQLQYSQVVILIFNGVFWPHVSVATMTLSAG